MTLPKQEWSRKEAPQHLTVKPDVEGQTATSVGQTAADIVHGG
jgi:hypothetical protein